jgi:hypothetical protein
VIEKQVAARAPVTTTVTAGAAGAGGAVATMLKKPGVPATESAAAEVRGSAGGGGEGSATAELETRATELMAVRKMPRHEANAKILGDDAGLRARYAAEQTALSQQRANERRPK